MKKNIINGFALFFLLLIAINAKPVFGQEDGNETGQTELITATPTPVPESPEKNAVTTLLTIMETLDEIKEEASSMEKELRTARTADQKVRAGDEINRLNQQFEDVESDFERVATGVDVGTLHAGPEGDFNWKKEVEDLLGPILNELKSMTERPRQIEKLRSQAEFYKNRLPIIEKAVENLQSLIDETEDWKLSRKLSNLKKDWENSKQQTLNQLKVVNYGLQEIEKQKRSLIESAQNIVRIFFKSRGKNFLFSLVVFVIVFLAFRFFHKLVQRISPGRKGEERPFYIRLFDVLYHILTFAGATCSMLIALYVSGDWVLLSLMIIFLLGIAWTAKQGLPRFYEQIKLLLNLGTVREHERVLYNGIPWKITSLNIYTYLENPELKGGTIRLPLKNLIDLTSRPFHKEEPWFPCRINDWVVLADETFGKVVAQTPDLVRVVLRGGSSKTYLTDEFMRMNPENLSRNFRINTTFGVDYGHQPISTDEVPEKMTEMIREKLEFDGYEKDLINLSVQFEAAGASSLDMAILADFNGRVAPYYLRLRRALQRYAVDACNKYGWVIPFTQLTLHTASTEDENPESESA